MTTLYLLSKIYDKKMSIIIFDIDILFDLILKFDTPDKGQIIEA